ncbi:MAG TPA: hypothetical protein VGU90_08825 [Terriglobales bacterium]|nr:hypothetical protein [Terriglobales bacterium]
MAAYPADGPLYHKSIYSASLLKHNLGIDPHCSETGTLHAGSSKIARTAGIASNVMIGPRVGQRSTYRHDQEINRKTANQAQAPAHPLS